MTEQVKKYCETDSTVPCMYDLEDPFCKEKCRNFFDGKKCKCYVTENTRPMTGQKYYDTFCGYMEGGVIYGCDSSCCEPKCPGECAQIEPRRRNIEHIPIGIDVSNSEIKSFDSNISIVKFLLYVIMVLALLSTISLWA